ncbi:glycosyltransferase family 2 protein [Prosthecomicrobium pneumaticum]|uniref:Cellulose synthase/poly-beta-1,6-N-acetylglucosamine synthase-like glycosyltransferase n=1 Tax=Prosthecomicrobium pneumaticum TaxID=81895 RepID=A0A7W9CU02_9HYPH|nr:glycosyltransferase family 2 protein [Prosthecomicrobium pneumaticum]MBB5751367.1 cellulose synthase/poly-beta-1,6-N-acetylglucosamine synthase-like glycosyltransferase [Prosthecomicrobium pneumaticum]
MTGFALILFFGSRPLGEGDVFYFFVIAGLFACSLAYQLSRFGTARRQAKRETLPPAVKTRFLSGDAPPVLVLVPSYREEQRVLAMTVLSAALTQYANRRIVVLIDDPPGDAASVAESLAAVEAVRADIEATMAPLAAAAAAWRRREATGRYDLQGEAKRIAGLYADAAFWLEQTAQRMEREITEAFRHVDTFFVDSILRDLAHRYRRHADGIAFARLEAGEVSAEYRRLSTLFCSQIETFQRKTFRNLSHRPNKAMNLNAFIGLLGAHYRVVDDERGRTLVRATADNHDLAIPSAKYILTLDADSVVRHEYLLELVHVLESRDTVAVAQTPYLTFPAAGAPVERTAGATTDIQFLAHQGTTYYNASYWVGANALIRLTALRSVRRERVEDGVPVHVFIQDDTVIEDTGSTIDLLDAGWAVHNHFAPLAYSATPADFGALAIQRKRWSNGGLIIAPWLMREYLASGERLRRLPELVIRANYLLSPLIGNACLLVLMMRNTRTDGIMLWTPLIIVPYFLLYALDLVRLGYRARDLFSVCALNLMLLPVSFAGIAASLRQMVTGRRVPFSRTPKVANRTYIPPIYFLFNIAMVALTLRYVANGIWSGHYTETLLRLIDVALYVYGIVVFIGLREGFADLVAWIEMKTEWMSRRLGRGRQEMPEQTVA